MIVYWKCKEFGAFQKDTNPIHLWEEEMKLWATIGPHTWTPAGFCVLLVFYDHFFFLTIQPFRAASQWQDHKNSRVQPLGWLSGFSVFALLIWTLKKIRMSDSAQNPNWRKPISPKIDKKCLDGVSKSISRFYRFWPISLWQSTEKFRFLWRNLLSYI